MDIRSNYINQFKRIHGYDLQNQHYIELFNVFKNELEVGLDSSSISNGSEDEEDEEFMERKFF